MQDKIILDRHLHLAQKVLVVDGLIGGGKYLVSSILSALPIGIGLFYLASVACAF